MQASLQRGARLDDKDWVLVGLNKPNTFMNVHMVLGACGLCYLSILLFGYVQRIC